MWSFNNYWQYDFPPFFTLQPNLSTREKQLEAWGRLVIDYCQFHKIFIVDLNEYLRSELFYNQKLNRKLDEKAIKEVFEFLEKKKHVEWTDNAKNRCHIYWRRPDEWAELLYDWARANGLQNAVLTLHEITQDESNRNESFYNLDREVLWRTRSQILSINLIMTESIMDETTAVKTHDSFKVGKQTFFNNEEIIKEGDTVIIYVDPDNIVSVVVKLGITCNMKNGALRHEFLIGKRYGTRLSATAGPIYALRPYPALWSKVLKRHTQILYTPECSLIINLLDLKPGDVVCESGTGSGSLTHALAAAVGPEGHVFTHDIEEPQIEKIKSEIKEHGLENCVTPTLQNVCVDGFAATRDCSAIFLDLPSPWLAISHVLKSFDRRKVCRLVSFSPCIEQAQELCELLRESDFYSIKTVELIGTTYKTENVRTSTLEELEMNRTERKTATRRNIREQKTNSTENGNHEEAMEDDSADSRRNPILIPYPHQQPTHAGYLTSATLFSPR
ncbi:ESCRT-II complex subunit VPS25 [Aphelenchoides besseyi]|nr:ESCRT-II complex subunit VPS25 [Aphelenchoides besseyi]KAI6207466.1 ESCRT-II complex subunit VPS25 [Aphelenchoides besseyi]